MHLYWPGPHDAPPPVAGQPRHVRLARDHDGTVLVFRPLKADGATWLRFTPAQWHRFTRAVKDGTLTIPRKG